MKKENNYRCASLLIILLFSLGFMSHATAIEMNKRVNDECADCHEKDGNATDGKTPGIAGISADYFIELMGSGL